MLRKDFKNLLSSLEFLTHFQRQKLLAQVRDNSGNSSIKLVESHSQDTNLCPHCGGVHLSRWGRSHGLQRYRCKECKKTFNALTGSSLSRLRHKELWLSYSQCLQEGMSIRKSAASCGVSKSTFFRWRHRFLSGPAQDKATKMVGIVEADETFFTESCKGDKHLTHRKPRKRGRSSKQRKGERVPVLIVRDRTGTVADFVFSHIEKEEMHNALKPLMSDEVVLCSDGNSIYQTFAKEEDIPHKRIIAINKAFVVDKIFHIQNLNSYIGRLKSWMVRFHGVATKYLDNYLGWRRVLEKDKDNISGEFFLLQALRKIDQQLTQT